MSGLDRDSKSFDPPSPVRAPQIPKPSYTTSPIFPILAYCGSSILMTTTNKYCLSGLDFNLNFFLLCVQVSSLINLL
jgi:GDP-mannose transporter